MNWKTAYLETRVLSADPVELVNILYEYATLRVQEARHCLALEDIAGRAKAITKTIAILGELESSLDHKLGGQIASNLAGLYRYMRERLTVANLKQADGPLGEVEALLKTLGEAWQAIGPQKVAEKNEYPGIQTPAEWASSPMLEPIAAYSAHGWSA
jgi:flagellar protein FliS